MKITVKAVKVGKTGTSDKGAWELIVVTSEDGTDYTTFHKGAKNLTPGSVVEFEPVIKDGKCSFKDYEVISTAPASSDNGHGMTPELWAEKDRLERLSRECNTCFMGIMELAKQPPADDKFREVYNLALDYAKAHFKPATKVETTKPKSSSSPRFANVGEFFARCQKEGVSRKQVLDKLNVPEGKASNIDTETAWQVIYEEIIKPSKEIEK